MYRLRGVKRSSGSYFVFFYNGYHNICGGFYIPPINLHYNHQRKVAKGGCIMAKVFITLTGTKHYFGNDFLKKGTKIRLEKESDNEYDKEAIKVTYEGLGKIGYVANSSYTVIGDSMSAGRLYDKIGKTAYAKVELVTPVGTICKVCKKSLKNEMKEEVQL